MKIKTESWGVGNKRIIHMREGLKRQFERNFKKDGIELLSSYYYKSKRVAIDYVVNKEVFLDKIKSWIISTNK